MGFLRPTSGRALIAGRDCWAESVTVHGGAAYLAGDVRLPRSMRGRDVISFFTRLRNGDDAAGFRLAQRLGLDVSRKVGQMSTGMRQKLALATVLSADVPLLVLDEPTSNLDPTVRTVVLQLIREARAVGRTVIFSSHIISEVEHACDRVAILREGCLVHDQVMSEIRRGHQIRVRIHGPLPKAPDNLMPHICIATKNDGEIVIDAPGELAPLLGWLSTLPIEHINVEPIGLGAVYEQYHPAERANEVAA
jgi:ABC-2 type transport system ATP-binding protein